MDDPRLQQLKIIFAEHGWMWRAGKDIPYGTQLILSDGSNEATLDFYPKRGRTVVGGANTPLRQALARITAEAETNPPAQAKATPMIQGAHIGMDESGKGDWFGPLVVAAVFIEPAQAEVLQQAGVRDSKQLAATTLIRLASVIAQQVPAAHRRVLVLEPDVYNRRYAELGNINLLLAELYAEAALPVQQATRSNRIVCDQFAQRTDRLDLAFGRAGLPKPIQQHHAEDASVAVAAASILATARFGSELERLGAEAGIARSLPRGASALVELRMAVQTIIAREGRAAVGRYAKLNFKPIQVILAD
ncbi:MAG: ribonuclease HIII [Oscillochloris sp.]|nr:ribonuclease HIII [Oscillochloris sp.]